MIAAFPQSQILDITGPLDVFSSANERASLRGLPCPYELILATPGAGLVSTTSGIDLRATHDLFDSTLVVDTVIFAGGKGARLMCGDANAQQEITALCNRTARVASICTGAFILAASGLLDNLRATTHWAHFDDFIHAFPFVRIDRDALFVAEGKFHTSAGITAGIDYALAVVEQDLGRKLALEVARALVVFLKRPGGQSQFSAQLNADIAATDPECFEGLTRWIAENLGGPILVAAMADRVAMSPRNFSRRLKMSMNMTPHAYVQGLRVDVARPLLTESSLPTSRVADRCGFVTVQTMRTEFQRHLGLSPEQYRARFQTTGIPETDKAAPTPISRLYR